MIRLLLIMSASKGSHKKRPALSSDFELDLDELDKRSKADESNTETINVAASMLPSNDAKSTDSAIEACRSPSPPKRVLTVPVSPSNRDRILAACSPAKVNCSLSFVGLSNPNIRFDFQAVVLIVYPACEKPDRRHVSLADRFGVTGITVWSTHVPMFTVQTVGLVVKITNLTVTTFNGKRNLAMSRDSSVRLLPQAEAANSDEHKWWKGRLSVGSLDISGFCSFDDDSIVSVSGIVFMIQTDTKRVRNEDKELLTLRIADSSGTMDVRSWHSTEAEFRSFIDKPILLQRVRVTSFAGIKIGEMLDGDGTVISSDFDGAQALANFWKAPSKIVDHDGAPA